MDKLQVEFGVLIRNQLMGIKKVNQKNSDLVNDQLKMGEEEMMMIHLERSMMVLEEDSLINHINQDQLDELNLSFHFEKEHSKMLIHHFVDYNFHLIHYDMDIRKN
jgi:hypothetical protein